MQFGLGKNQLILSPIYSDNRQVAGTIEEAKEFTYLGIKFNNGKMYKTHNDLLERRAKFLKADTKAKASQSLEPTITAEL